MHSGVANLPLHPGKAPRWLFQRMEKLAGSMSEIMIDELGHSEFLKRISDPFWFQAFACVLGFDWHSSGTTTVAGGALKAALNKKQLGIFASGGKGKSSNNTQLELEDTGMKLNLSTRSIEDLKYTSRICAKVDSACVQDGHQLYYHTIFVAENKDWAIIQQGMNGSTNYARRYHWLRDSFDSYVETPHKAICGENNNAPVLDMTSGSSDSVRKCSTDLIKDLPNFEQDLKRLVNLVKQQPKRKKNKPLQIQRGLEDFDESPDQEHLDISDLIDKAQVLNMPRTIDWAAMKRAYDKYPSNYQQVIETKGIGPATVRALALVSDLIYGEEASWKDPVKYSFAVGGKDGVPYPVNKKVYDTTLDILRSGIEESKLDNRSKLDAVKRLRRFTVSS